MKPRRVHELMRVSFPAFDAVEHAWTNMHDGSQPKLEELDELLRRFIAAPEVVVEVHRRLGALLPISEAAAFIGSLIGEGQIRVADRDFTSFVVVAVNGVAMGWRTTDLKSIESGSATASAHFQLCPGSTEKSKLPQVDFRSLS